MSPKKRTFEVTFNDYNKRLFETDSIHSLISYLLFELKYYDYEIIKIEERR